MTDVLPASTAFDLDDKYQAESGSFFFTGVQALVRVPLDQMRADRQAGLSSVKVPWRSVIVASALALANRCR